MFSRLLTAQARVSHQSLSHFRKAIKVHVSSVTAAVHHVPKRWSTESQTSTNEGADPPFMNLTINGRAITVPVTNPDTQRPTTILEAAKAGSIHIPTLCFDPSLQQPSPAVCRICLVHVEGSGKEVPACYTPAQEGMRVSTHAPDLEEDRKHNLEMMLARHPNECMTCEANRKCEFQDLVYHYQLEDKWPKWTRGTVEPGLSPMTQVHEAHLHDHTSPAIEIDFEKCILCGRCATACTDVQNMNIIGRTGRGEAAVPHTIFDVPLKDTNCISCGQCTLHCPTAALIERPDLHRCLGILDSKSKICVVQTAPATRVTIGEMFGLAPGSVSTGKLVAALRALGFDYVFDTNFSADLTIMEEGGELLQRVEQGGPFPMFTSCCPGWINMVEKEYPEYIPHLSTAKSPQQMHGALTKEYFAQKIGKDPKDVFTVSIMPCTAKKDEAARPNMRDVQGERHVDLVLTTRELGRLIELRSIPFVSLEDSEYDSPLGKSTGAAVVFGATGGVMEAALRTAIELHTGEVIPRIDYGEVRGLDRIKRATVKMGDVDVRVAVAHGGKAVREICEEVKAAKRPSSDPLYHFIEMMACPGGCIGGGGEPKSLDPHILDKRMESIYRIDRHAPLRKSHENPDIHALYQDIRQDPDAEHNIHRWLHTQYYDRKPGYKEDPK